MNPQMPPKLSLPGVKNVIAVASGKGGVGKSTVAANLAMALHMNGAAVGLMDADIYGPSVPIMFGLGMVDPQKTPFPLEKYGIKLMSMGFMVAPSRRSSGAGRRSRRPCRHSSGRSTGASSITSSSTCRPAPATRNSRSARARRLTGAVDRHHAAARSASSTPARA